MVENDATISFMFALSLVAMPATGVVASTRTNNLPELRPA
ncbi:hypothetical protein DFO67_101234 [Modicisalibacter xianhensis]|uniref:Uncharacterized protein n=1 Tax=Modicisalibacter xianhensis TaxID=442341 RepID=A0A4R8G8D0_9GAMM|nr:hypothetical protein DFO67_101234 [Halomonas xianhensis]